MFRLVNKLKNKKGFTLIELIVVLAVLGIIMAIAVPRFVGVQEQAKIDADYASGSLIAKTAEIYSAKGMNATDIESKLQDDFPQDIKFQSSKISGQTLDDVKITVANGSVTVKVTKGSTDYEIYPENDLDE